jgi:hypothetical protein
LFQNTNTKTSNTNPNQQTQQTKFDPFNIGGSNKLTVQENSNNNLLSDDNKPTKSEPKFAKFKKADSNTNNTVTPQNTTSPTTTNNTNFFNISEKPVQNKVSLDSLQLKSESSPSQTLNLQPEIQNKNNFQKSMSQEAQGKQSDLLNSLGNINFSDQGQSNLMGGFYQNNAGQNMSYNPNQGGGFYPGPQFYGGYPNYGGQFVGYPMQYPNGGQFINPQFGYQPYGGQQWNPQGGQPNQFNPNSSNLNQNPNIEPKKKENEEKEKKFDGLY